MSLDAIYDLSYANQRIAELQAQLAKYQQDADAAQEKIQAVMAEVADNYLMSPEGEPINGVVYWYSSQAILRFNGGLHLVPIFADSSKEIAARLNGDATDEPL
jgi:hypothetical protein